MVQQRIDPIPVYEWELNENHTRYDYSRAIPDEDSLYIQFAALAGINGVVAAVCLILILSLVRYKKTRDNSFNMYILFTAIPDFVSSFGCMLTCAMSAPLKEYHGEVMCGFQSFYLAWGFTANCWMNAAIVYQIHKLLRFSHIRKRYFPPTRKQVLLQVAVVYVYAAGLAFLGVWNIPKLPHKTHLYHGMSCFPLEYDLGSTLFYWLFFIPAFLLLPVVYTTYVMWDIYHRSLLPPIGRRRDLSIYFFRLVLVYYIMWMPFLLICTIGNITALSSWIWWAGAAWSHFQGIVSAAVSLTKADIRSSVTMFLTCVPENEDDGGADQMGSQRYNFARRMSIMHSFQRILGRGNSYWSKSFKANNADSPRSGSEHLSQGKSAVLSHRSRPPSSMTAAMSEVQHCLEGDYEKDEDPSTMIKSVHFDLSEETASPQATEPTEDDTLPKGISVETLREIEEEDCSLEGTERAVEILQVTHEQQHHEHQEQIIAGQLDAELQESATAGSVDPELQEPSGEPRISEGRIVQEGGEFQ